MLKVVTLAILWNPVTHAMRNGIYCKSWLTRFHWGKRIFCLKRSGNVR
jgi:hypothetical protein